MKPKKGIRQRYLKEMEGVPKQQRERVADLLSSLGEVTDSDFRYLTRRTPELLNKYGIDSYAQIVEALKKVDPANWGFDEGGKARTLEKIRSPQFKQFFKHPVFDEPLPDAVDLGWRLIYDNYPHHDEHGTPLPADLLLVNIIHDPHSASTIKPLVDMNDPHVKKAYAERIRRFY